MPFKLRAPLILPAFLALAVPALVSALLWAQQPAQKEATGPGAAKEAGAVKASAPAAPAGAVKASAPGAAQPPLPAGRPPASPQVAPPAKPAGAIQIGGAPLTEAARAGAAPVNHPQAVKTIERYLETLGGQKVLEGIDDKVVKFRVTLHASTGENVATMDQYLKKGYKVREEMNIEGVKIKDMPLGFVQVYNGSEGWVKEMITGTVSALEGRTLTLFVWDKLLDDFFCHWEDDGYTVDFVGVGTVDNEPVEIVEVTDFGNSARRRHFFSKQSGLLLKSESREPGQQGMVKKETFYKRYVKIPFSDRSGRAVQFSRLHEVYADGDLESTREFTEVVVNGGIKDSIFERPEGEEFKGAITGSPPVALPGAGGAPPAVPVGGGHPAVGGGGRPAVGGGHPQVNPVKPAPAPPTSTAPRAVTPASSTPPAGEKAGEKKK